MIKQFRYGKNGKLVRDKLYDITIAEGHEVEIDYYDKKDMPKILVDKLKEEVDELSSAVKDNNAEKTKDELADILTVVKAVAKAMNLSIEDVENRERERRP